MTTAEKDIRVFGHTGKGESLTAEVKPFDRDFYVKYILGILENDGQVVEPSGDSLHTHYHWADIGEIERRRLEIQNHHTLWGLAHRAQHEKLSGKFQPADIAVIGISGGAEQLKTLLELYPEAQICAIEVDGRKITEAKAALEKTHLKDVESGRVHLIEGNAIEKLSEPKNYGIIEADKIVIHQTPEQREGLIKAVDKALAPGGIFQIGDVLAGNWRTSVVEGFEENNTAKEAVGALNNLMPVILDAAWRSRRDKHWKTTGDLDTEILGILESGDFVPLNTHTQVYEPLPTTVDKPEAIVSLLIAMTPWLVIKGLRRRGGDNPPPEEAEKKMGAVAKTFVEAAFAPGVNIHLPPVVYRTYQKPYEIYRKPGV